MEASGIKRHWKLAEETRQLKQIDMLVFMNKHITTRLKKQCA